LTESSDGFKREHPQTTGCRQSERSSDTAAAQKLVLACLKIYEFKTCMIICLVMKKEKKKRKCVQLLLKKKLCIYDFNVKSSKK